MVNKSFRQIIAPSLSLFTSLSTLICCALPALLVTLGMGASLVSLFSLFPWIIIISKYKILIFTLSGVLLLISSYLFWKGRNLACPIDIKQAKICIKLRFYNLIIIIISSIIYITGFFFAFLANDLFY